MALLIVDFRIKCWLKSRIGTLSCGAETDAADVKIFLEAIELEEVGEFQCADISALRTDFLLEIGDHALQVFSAEAGVEELIPEPWPSAFPAARRSRRNKAGAQRYKDSASAVALYLTEIDSSPQVERFGVRCHLDHPRERVCNQVSNGPGPSRIIGTRRPFQFRLKGR